MLQIIQNLKSGDTILEQLPAPEVSRGFVLIKTIKSVASLNTKKMLVEFGKSSLISKVPQQPNRVKEVLDKIKSARLMLMLASLFNKLDQPSPIGYCNVGKVNEVGEVVTEFIKGNKMASNENHAQVVYVHKNLVAHIPENISDNEAAFTVIDSIGIQKINNQQELEKLIANNHKKGAYDFMMQQLVNMRKDLRVNIIGNEIVLHYWRINQAKEWKPTSTSYGSNVDFITFPKMWREKKLTNFKKNNFTTGDFDITWQNDDVNNEPIFQEINTDYLSKTISRNASMAYSNYKYSVFVKKLYWIINLKQIITIKKQKLATA